MTKRVLLTRKEEEHRRARQEVSSITQDDTVDEEDFQDDEGVKISPKKLTSWRHPG